MIGQLPYRSRLIHLIELGHNRRIEKLREKRKIATVVRYRIHKVLHLTEKLIQVFHLTHLPLNQSQSHNRLAGVNQLRRFDVIYIAPLQKRRILLRAHIAGQIPRKYSFYVKIITELKAENRVMYLLASYFLNILLGRQSVRILAIIRYPPPEKYPPQV